MARDVIISIKAEDQFSTVLDRYKRAVGNAGNATTEAAKKNRTFAQSLTDIQSAVDGVLSAGIVKQFADVVGQLNKLGMSARSTGQVFGNLTRDIGGYANVLSTLKQATGGIVDDTTLMASSNKLLLTGVAQNKQQLVEMTQIATRLGAAFGRDAATALDDFTLMMANRSKMRLDQFGISAAEVTQKINDLKAQGFGDEEAWNIAVIETARDAVEQVGKVGETAFSKVGTQIKDATTQLGLFVAGALEAGAQLALLPDMLAELNVKQDAERYAAEHGLDPNNMEYSQTAFGFGVLGGQTVLNETGTVPGSTSLLYADPYVGSRDNYTQGTMGMTPEQLSRMNIMGRESMIGSRARYMLTSGISGGFNAVGNAYDSFLAPGQADYDDSFTNFQARFGDIQTEAFRGTGNLGLMSEDAIASSISGYEQLKSIQEQLESHPFVREDHVNLLDRMVDHAGELAREAEKARAAFENMSLGGMLGQESGGRLGDFTDLIVSNVDDPEAKEGLTRSLNLASGRETDLSVEFEENFAPLIADIYETMGEDVAIQAAQGALAALEQGQLAGLSADEIIENAQLAIGYKYDSGGGTEIDVQPGDNLYTLANQYGGGADDYRHLLDNNGFLQPGQYGGGGGGIVPYADYSFPQPEGGASFGGDDPGGFTMMQDAIEAAKESVQDLSSTEVEIDTSVAEDNVNNLDALLKTIVNTAWAVTIDVNYNDPGPPGAVGGSGGSVGGSNDARRNGGSVAGEDGRTGQIPIG